MPLEVGEPLPMSIRKSGKANLYFMWRKFDKNELLLLLLSNEE
jgi:hypothetical protein